MDDLTIFILVLFLIITFISVFVGDNYNHTFTDKHSFVLANNETIYNCTYGLGGDCGYKFICGNVTYTCQINFKEVN